MDFLCLGSGVSQINVLSMARSNFASVSWRHSCTLRASCDFHMRLDSDICEGLQEKDVLEGLLVSPRSGSSATNHDAVLLTRPYFTWTFLQLGSIARSAARAAAGFRPTRALPATTIRSTARVAALDIPCIEDDAVTIRRSVDIPSDLPVKTTTGLISIPSRRSPGRDREGPWTICAAETPHDASSYSLRIQSKCSIA